MWCRAVLARTNSLTSAKGWTVWNGTSYVANPVSWDEKLYVLPGISVPESMMTTITWSASVCEYIVVFAGSGVQFATTPTLASPQLSELRTVAGGGGLTGANYPIMQDDTFTGFNFHALESDTAFLYTVRQNGGLDRDVVKQQVTLSASGPPPAPSPVPPPPAPSPSPAPSPVHAIYRCALPTGAHLTSVRSDCEAVPGAKQEAVLGYLSNANTQGAHGLYRCSVAGRDYFVSVQSDCEGATVDGMLGFIWDAPTSTSAYRSSTSNSDTYGVQVALYRCLMADKHHMTSLSASCEGGGSSEGVMGYVRSSPSPSSMLVF
jgi:hypothetical protein